MDREIKFRGRNARNGDWVYGYFFVSEGGFDTIITESGGFVKVIAGTKGQYTGIKDKNGTEIYEGDVWMFSEGSVKTHCEIIFENCRFKAVRSEDGFEMLEYYGASILEAGEVIGNIYNNQELIEQ